MQWGLCTCDKNLAEEADTHALAHTHTLKILFYFVFLPEISKNLFRSLLIHTSGQTALNVCFRVQLL